MVYKPETIAEIERKTIADMGPEFTLLQNNQDIEDVGNFIGWDTSIYACLFVEVLPDGDYGEVWGCIYYTPELHRPVERIK